MSLLTRLERQALWQDLGQQRTADGGLDHRRRMLHRSPSSPSMAIGDAHLDARLQFDSAGLVGTVHFLHVGEDHAFALWR